MFAASCVEFLSPNIARLGTATQKSNYHHTHLFPGDPDYAHYAIDGNVDTDLNAGARCAVTWNNAGAWWQVDLLQDYNIEKVAITTTASGKLCHLHIQISHY